MRELGLQLAQTMLNSKEKLFLIHYDDEKRNKKRYPCLGDLYMRFGEDIMDIDLTKKKNGTKRTDPTVG